MLGVCGYLVVIFFSFLFLDKKKQKSSLHIISQENYLVSLYATQVARRSSPSMRVASVPSFVVFQRNYIRAVEFVVMHSLVGALCSGVSLSWSI